MKMIIRSSEQILVSGPIIDCTSSNRCDCGCRGANVVIVVVGVVCVVGEFAIEVISRC
jgi:hypothetical protein